MAGSKKLEVQIVGDASKLTKSFGQASKSASSFGDKMMKAGKLAALGLGAGVAVVGVALKKSVDAALDAEKAQTRLDAAFKATNASAKERAESMKQVNDVSIKSGLDDEDLMDTLGKLTRVTGDTSKAQRDMAIAADIARARGIDLSAATGIVTKAQLGLVGGLKRIGIEIPKVTAAQDALRASHVKATAEQVKAAKAADDVATRQSAIAALQKQYAGAAEAYGKTAAGAQERFQVAVENLQEALGAKLLPVLTRVLGWAVDNMPTFERVAKTVFDNVGKALGALAAFFEANWPRIKQAGATVLAWYQNNLQPTIISITQNIARAWGTMTDSLKSDTERNFGSSGGGGGGILGFVVARMSVMLHFFNAALAALRGDWSKAWSELNAGAQQNLSSMKDLWVSTWSLIFRAVMAIVGKLVSGIVSGLKGLPVAVAGMLSALGAQISGWAGSAYAYAFRIGSQIVSGILGGLGNLAGAVRDKVVGGLKGAISSAGGILHGSGDFMFTKQAVGEKLAQGITDGFAGGFAQFTPQVKAKIQKAIDAAKAVLDAAKGKFQTAFSLMSDKVLRSFDAERGGISTPAEQALKAISDRRANEDLQKALADAMLGGDPEAIARAREDIQVAALERQAMIERTALDQQTDTMREKLETKLATMAQVWTGGTDQILKLLAGYGIDFATVGALLGTGFRDSLIESIMGASRTARTVGGLTGVGPGAGGGNQTIVLKVDLDGDTIAETTYKNLLRKQARNESLGLT